MPRDRLTFFTDRDLGLQFPRILRDSGLDVRLHQDHFSPDCPDEVWLKAIGQKKWIAISHDNRIRYKPNEKQAIIYHHARLLIVIGKAPFQELALHFVNTVSRIERFIEAHPAPWIAKVYRPTTKELQKRTAAPGSVTLWYPDQQPGE